MDKDKKKTFLLETKEKKIILLYNGQKIEIANEDIGVMTWYDAVKLQKNGWRLPTIEELTMLQKSQRERMPEYFIPLRDDNKGYWTQTSYKENTSLAWLVENNKAERWYSGKATKAMVRFVRNL